MARYIGNPLTLGCGLGDGGVIHMSAAERARHLYIVGASLWPTCGTANPTLTVAALALRAAERIADAEFGRQLEPLP